MILSLWNYSDIYLKENLKDLQDIDVSHKQVKKLTQIQHEVFKSLLD